MDENADKTLDNISTKLLKAINNKLIEKTTFSSMHMDFIEAFTTYEFFNNMRDQLIWKLDQK